MKRIDRFVLALSVLTCLSPEAAHTQFISQTTDRGSYLNYAGRNYENYSTGLLRRKFYDNFGNFLVDGVSVFNLDERTRTATGDYASPTSYLSKSRFYSSYFSNLVILNDSYSGLTSRLMIGDAIRTKFTSLTLDKARFNGVRWDLATTKYRGTLVASRVSDPIRMDPENVLTSAQQIYHTREWTAYLLGGHFETDLGDVLTLGATYVNQSQRRSSTGAEGASLKGSVSNAVPRVIFIKIKDDSPGDNSGPIIYGAPQIFINGAAYPMKNINGQVPDPLHVDIRSPIQYWVLRNYDHVFYAIYPAADTLSETQYVNYRIKSSPKVSPLPSYPTTLPSDREDIEYNLTYAYVIPAGVDRVEFNAILANDYRIDGSHDWINNIDEYTNTLFRSHADSIVVGRAPVPTFFRTLVRADGNVKDGSNRKIVHFSYGLVTGMSVYSLNLRFNWNNFKIEGEFAQSLEYFKYPISQGFRFENAGQAFFIRGTKTIGRITLGAERYRIDPSYTTLLDLYTMDNTYYGDFSTPDRPDRTTFDASAVSSYAAPGDYNPQKPGGAAYALVDDNDDNDRWEDGFYHYNVQAYPNVLNGDVVNFDYPGGQKVPGFIPKPLKMGYRQNANELIGLGDIIRKPDAGIFPGKDKDRDGIPDDDRNSNGIPDYAEDFLTYYSDPPSFDYGDDWNNNGVIDQQENDILPDYPYNPDIDGHHVFGIVELLRSMNLRVGSIRENSVARGGKNYSDYVRWNYESGTPKFGSVNLLYIFKRVKDNIPNNGYQFGAAITISSPIPTFTFDSLEYKNSAVHQFYVGTSYTQIPGVNIENIVKYEYNNQYKIGVGLRDNLYRFLNPDEQSDGHITKMGIVNKIDYTYSLFDGRLKVIPQFKVRTQKISKFGEFIPGKPANLVVTNYQEILPILRLDYRLTERTYLRFGLQGIPPKGGALNYQVRNLKSPEYDANATTYAISVNNRSSYGGYNVVVDLGYKFTSVEQPKHPDIRLRNQEISYIFMTVYAGF